MLPYRGNLCRGTLPSEKISKRIINFFRTKDIEHINGHTLEVIEEAEETVDKDKRDSFVKSKSNYVLFFVEIL